MKTKFKTGTDVFLSSITPNTQRGQNPPHNKWCYLEYENGIEIRSLINWKTSLPAGSYVSKVSILLYTDTPTSYGTIYGVYAMSKKWCNEKATWHTCNGSNKWLRVGGDFGSTLLAEFTIPQQNWFEIELNDAGVEWFQSTVDSGTNYGLLLKRKEGTGRFDRFKGFKSKDDYAPQLIVTYNKNKPDQITKTKTSVGKKEVGKKPDTPTPKNITVIKIPGINTEAVNWLLDKGIHNKRVFEYGSGASTSFFAKYTKRIISVEFSPQQYDKMKENSQNTGIKFIEAEINTTPYPYSFESYGTTNKTHIDYQFKNYVNSIRRYKKLDIIFINGRSRSSCIREAIKKIKKGGYIILNDPFRLEYQNAIELFLKKYPRKNFEDKMNQTSIWTIT